MTLNQPLEEAVEIACADSTMTFSLSSDNGRKKLTHMAARQSRETNGIGIGEKRQRLLDLKLKLFDGVFAGRHQIPFIGDNHDPFAALMRQ